MRKFGTGHLCERNAALRDVLFEQPRAQRDSDGLVSLLVALCASVVRDSNPEMAEKSQGITGS